MATRLVEAAPGVWTATSRMDAMSSVVVAGDAGALVVDPGVFPDELAGIEAGLAALGAEVACGFSTHGHWDHLLWSPGLGSVPRWATAVTVARARIERDTLLSEAAATVGAAAPHAFGELRALDADVVPWSGPPVEVVRYDGHARGQAALWLPTQGVLIAGDVLSDVEVPTPSWDEPDAVAAYRDGLDRLSRLAVKTVIPGHGHPGDRGAFAERLAWDRSYLDRLEAGEPTDDPRLMRAPGYVRAMHDANVRAVRRPEAT